MLFLEMMKDEDHAPRAVRAAAASGLPVFLGISTRTDEKTGDIVHVLFGSGNDSVPLTKKWFDSLKDLLGDNLVGVNVMHTNFSTMSKTLSFVRQERCSGTCGDVGERIWCTIGGWVLWSWSRIYYSSQCFYKTA